MSAQNDVAVEAVVARLAEELETNVLDLEPLATVVDPELVTRFVTADALRPGSELRFRYEGREVRIDENGDVTIEETY